MPPRCPNMIPRCSGRLPRGFRNRPGLCSCASDSMRRHGQTVPGATEWSQDVPNYHQDDRKMTARCSGMFPRRPKILKTSKMTRRGHPKVPQWEPRAPNGTPRTPRDFNRFLRILRSENRIVTLDPVTVVLQTRSSRQASRHRSGPGGILH